MHVLTHISIGVYLSVCVLRICCTPNGEIHCQICNCTHTCAVSPTRQRMQAEKDEIINRAKSKVSYLKNPFILAHQIYDNLYTSFIHYRSC